MTDVRAPAPSRARDERGSAVVEFVVLAVLMLIPLVYLVHDDGAPAGRVVSP